MYKVKCKATLEINTINFEGNIIPHEWYSFLKTDKGHTDIIAIILLGELVYLHRPVTVLKNNKTIKLQKFEGDKLSLNVCYFTEKFGFTDNQVRDALKRLEERHKIIVREYKTAVFNGKRMSNLMFFTLDIKRLKEITHPIDPDDDLIESLEPTPEPEPKPNLAASESKPLPKPKPESKSVPKPVSAPSKPKQAVLADSDSYSPAVYKTFSPSPKPKQLESKPMPKPVSEFLPKQSLDDVQILAMGKTEKGLYEYIKNFYLRLRSDPLAKLQIYSLCNTLKFPIQKIDFVDLRDFENVIETS